MSWLDGFFSKTVSFLFGGSSLPSRSAINYASPLYGTDNQANGTTDVSVLVATNSASGSMTPAQYNRLAGVGIDITEYGADPSGTVAADAAIAAAFAAAGVNGTVRIPIGVFKVTASITGILAGQTIVGLGRGSILRASAASFHVFLPSNTCHGVTLRNFAIEGAATTAAALASGTGQFGVYTGGGGPNFWTIDDLWISGPNSSTGCNNGIKIDTCTDWKIRRPYFEYLIGSDGTVGLGYGVLMGVATRVTVDDWQYYGNQSASPIQGRHGVYTTGGCTDISIRDGKCYNTKEDSIPLNDYLTQSPNSNITISGNEIWNKGAGNTSSVGSADISVSGQNNRVRIIGNKSFGTDRNSFLVTDIGMGRNCHDIEISNNYSEGAGLEGIAIQGSPNVYGAGNVIVDCSKTSIGSSSGMVVIANGSGSICDPCDEICVGLYCTTRRRWEGAEITIATPPTLVTWGNENQITGVALTNGTTITVTTYSAHGFSPGDIVAITRVKGVPQINGRVTIAATPLTTTFTVTFGSSGSGTYTAGTGSVLGKIAHGLNLGDPVQVAGITTNATATGGAGGSMNGHFLATVPDVYTLGLESAPSTASVGGGSASLTVSGATNATPIVVQFSGAHGLVTGNRLLVTGVGGNLDANGMWSVTVVDSTNVQLDNSIGVSNYTSGGTATSIGYLLAPTHRDWITINPTGPSPRGFKVHPATGGIPGYQAADIQANGIPVAGMGPIYAAQPEMGDPFRPCAGSGDIRVPQDFQLRAFNPAKSSPGTTGSDRLFYRQASDGAFYIGQNDMTGGAIVAQDATGFFSVQCGMSTQIRVLGTFIQSNVPVTQTGTITVGSGGIANTVVTDTYSSTISMNFANGNHHKVTLTGSPTINATGFVSGQTFAVIVIQGGSGSNLVTWGSNFKFPAATAPTLSITVGAVDVISGVSDGTNLLVTTTALSVH